MRHRGYNQVLHDELDRLEKNEGNMLSNRNQANVFGSVRNALVYSENILLSFDDVLHYNHAIEKAKTAIDFANPPTTIKSTLKEILALSIKYQNEKQTQTLIEARQFVNHTNIGQTANNTFYLGAAAQNYNLQLQGELTGSSNSILNSQGMLNRLLHQNAEFIRFTPDKLEQALAFYQHDYEKFQRALNGDFSTVTTQEMKLEISPDELEKANRNAFNLINEIQNYLSEPD